MAEGRTPEEAEVPLLTGAYLLAGGRSNRPQPPQQGYGLLDALCIPRTAPLFPFLWQWGSLPLEAIILGFYPAGALGPRLLLKGIVALSCRPQPACHLTERPSGCLAEYATLLLSSWCSLVLQVCSTVPRTEPGHAVGCMAPGGRQRCCLRPGLRCGGSTNSRRTVGLLAVLKDSPKDALGGLAEPAGQP